MKRSLFVSVLSSILFLGTAVAQTQQPAPTEKEVIVGISEAYVPGGFDINSDVYIVAGGIFPNGCYRWKQADVKHESDFVHEVKVTATVKQGMCLMVLVPFNKEIRLGKFVAGEHTIKFMSGDGTFLEKKVSIK